MPYQHCAGIWVHNDPEYVACVRCAATIFQLVKTASQGDLKAQRITVNYADHAYVICASEKKIHVVKKSTAVPEVVA